MSFSLTSVFSFIFEKNNYKVSINIQEQYNMFVNLPKNFIGICVKVGYDIKTFTNSQNKKQNIFGNNYKFDQTPIALIYSTTKTKVVKNLWEYNNLLFTLKNIYIIRFIIPIIIFYLLCYIGLLRLFGSISLISLQMRDMENSVYGLL